MLDHGRAMRARPPEEDAVRHEHACRTRVLGQLALALRHYAAYLDDNEAVTGAGPGDGASLLPPELWETVFVALADARAAECGSSHERRHRLFFLSRRGAFDATCCAGGALNPYHGAWQDAVTCDALRRRWGCHGDDCDKDARCGDGTGFPALRPAWRPMHIGLGHRRGRMVVWLPVAATRHPPQPIERIERDAPRNDAPPVGPIDEGNTEVGPRREWIGRYRAHVGYLCLNGCDNWAKLTHDQRCLLRHIDFVSAWPGLRTSPLCLSPSSSQPRHGAHYRTRPARQDLERTMRGHGRVLAQVREATADIAANIGSLCFCVDPGKEASVPDYAAIWSDASGNRHVFRYESQIVGHGRHPAGGRSKTGDTDGSDDGPHQAATQRSSQSAVDSMAVDQPQRRGTGDGTRSATEN